MLDWPNLLAGAALGVLGTLAFWLPDKARTKRQVRNEARVSWTVAAHQIAIAMSEPTMTWGDFYRLRAGYPIDHWRTVLGGHDFDILDRLDFAFMVAENNPSQANLQALDFAAVEFTNLNLTMQAESQIEAARVEERQQMRRARIRHPFHLWKGLPARRRTLPEESET